MQRPSTGREKDFDTVAIPNPCTESPSIHAAWSMSHKDLNSYTCISLPCAAKHSLCRLCRQISLELASREPRSDEPGFMLLATGSHHTYTHTRPTQSYQIPESEESVVIAQIPKPRSIWACCRFPHDLPGFGCRTDQHSGLLVRLKAWTSTTV